MQKGICRSYGRPDLEPNLQSMKISLYEVKFGLLLLTFFIVYTNARAGSPDYRIVSGIGPAEGPGEVNMPFEFPGWNRKQAITINGSMVSGSTDLADFPFLVTLDHLDAEVVNGGFHSALNGGGDLRFSSDAEGNTRLAIEVVEFVTSPTLTDRKCQIWVKVPNISATSDTIIYVWYNNAGETQPPASDPFGSQAVWSNGFVSQWHLEQDPSANSPQFFDSSTNGNHGVASATMVAADSKTAQIGRGIELDGSTKFVTLGNPSSLNLTANMTISIWFRPKTNSDGYLFAKRAETVNTGYTMLMVGGGPVAYHDGSKWYQTGMVPNIDQWNYLSIKFNTAGTAFTMFLNGAFSAEFSIPQMPDGLAQNLYLGKRGPDNFHFNGFLDEFKIADTVRSNDWISTEYNNQNSPSTFASKGIPEDLNGDGTAAGGLWDQLGNDIGYIDGNVGIGTVPQSGYRLAVDGTVHTREVRIDIENWPDYVFMPDYRLPSLQDVKKHIDDKGHLANVPSAAAVSLNGVQIGAMNRILLEKIEELTLYAIEQNKEQKRLEKEVSEIERNRKN